MERRARLARFWAATFLCILLFAPGARAADYAAMVIDARSGEVLHARNADTRLHPASLTKMMTLYIAFQAVENGELSMDTVVTVSKKAAAEPPSKLGLYPGQKIKLRYLVRAAAIKSANDAATAIGEAIEGSEAAFARRMNRTAKALGMTRTTFKNAHGLTESGHLSTARDMTLMGRHLFYDFPAYYNMFKRKSTDAGVANVANTNRRFLGAYRGADGIKTGYTRAAGFNLVASAERGQERIIATMFGGRSTTQRNARVAELLDMGFERAPTRVAEIPPIKPRALPGDGTSVGKIVNAVRAPERSLFPAPRPVETPDDRLLLAMAETIEATIATVAPPELPEGEEVASLDTVPSVTRLLPRPRPDFLTAPPEQDVEEERVVVERLSTSGGRHWGISVGRYTSRHQAERVLLQTALTELGTLGEALRKVRQHNEGFDANFVGLSAEAAELACRRLTARNIACTTLEPAS